MSTDSLIQQLREVAETGLLPDGDGITVSVMLWLEDILKEHEEPSEIPLLDPEMKADEIRLHMGEMTAQEMRTARAAIGWANSVARGNPPYKWPLVAEQPVEYPPAHDIDSRAELECKYNKLRSAKK